MACASCKKKRKSPSLLQGVQGSRLFGAGDISVLQEGNRHRFTAADWPADKHKLIIFVPEAFTPVCETELGALNAWYDAFQKLDCELYAASTDPIVRMEDWIGTEPLLSNPKYRILSSYLLPMQLGLLEDGRAKRSSVFVTRDGEVVKMEHFDKVGRSMAELHRMLHGYTTDSYCAEGWTSPEDGFLEAPE